MRIAAHTTVIVGLLGLLLLPGCTYIASGRETPDSEIGKESSPQSSFVYGFIDMADADPDLDWVIINRVETGKQPKVYPMRTKDGIFYLENLPQGSYFVVEFGGRATNFFSAGTLVAFRPHYFKVGSDIKEYRFKIENPGFYYLGSWKYKPLPGGLFEDDKYDLIRLKEPDRKGLLTKIMEEAKGTPWEAKLRNHLKTVK